MKMTLKFTAILLLFVGLLGCSKQETKTSTKESETKKTVTEESKETSKNQPASTQINSEDKSSKNKTYSDLTEFWTDFKKFALAGDYDKITEMTRFPFLHQSSEMSKTEFKDFTFTDNFLEGMKTKKTPKKSEMMFMGIKSGEMYEVEYNGQALYFSKINGEWKFVGLLYGE